METGGKVSKLKKYIQIAFWFNKGSKSVMWKKFKTILSKNQEAFHNKITGDEIIPRASQLALTYNKLKQQWAYVTQTINQMKKRLGMDSILSEEKNKWWENIQCITNCST